jgi:hypothetical protein
MTEPEVPEYRHVLGYNRKAEEDVTMSEMSFEGHLEGSEAIRGSMSSVLTSEARHAGIKTMGGTENAPKR